MDWYTFGIFIYEMMVGRCPYTDKDPMLLYEKILTQKIKFPNFFDRKAKDLIRNLTKHDLSQRYGNLKDGVKDIMQHRFFAKTSFYLILN